MQLLMMNHISDAEGQGGRIKKEEKKVLLLNSVNIIVSIKYCLPIVVLK